MILQDWEERQKNSVDSFIKSIVCHLAECRALNLKVWLGAHFSFVQFLQVGFGAWFWKFMLYNENPVFSSLEYIKK